MHKAMLMFQNFIVTVPCLHLRTHTGHQVLPRQMSLQQSRMWNDKFVTHVELLDTLREIVSIVLIHSKGENIRRLQKGISDLWNRGRIKILNPLRRWIPRWSLLMKTGIGQKKWNLSISIQFKILKMFCLRHPRKSKGLNKFENQRVLFQLSLPNHRATMINLSIQKKLMFGCKWHIWMHRVCPLLLWLGYQKLTDPA